MLKRSVLMAVSVSCAFLGIPQAIRAQAPTLEGILRGANVEYKSRDGGGFLVTLPGTNPKAVGIAEERMIGSEGNRHRFAHVYWTIALPVNINVPNAIYQKLNDLDNNDILGNITLLQGKDGRAWVSGDYVFPLVEGTSSRILSVYLAAAGRDFLAAQKIVAGLGQ